MAPHKAQFTQMHLLRTPITGFGSADLRSSSSNYYTETKFIDLMEQQKAKFWSGERINSGRGIPRKKPAIGMLWARKEGDVLSGSRIAVAVLESKSGVGGWRLSAKTWWTPCIATCDGRVFQRVGEQAGLFLLAPQRKFRQVVVTAGII